MKLFLFTVLGFWWSGPFIHVDISAVLAVVIFSVSPIGHLIHYVGLLFTWSYLLTIAVAIFSVHSRFKWPSSVYIQDSSGHPIRPYWPWPCLTSLQWPSFDVNPVAISDIILLCFVCSLLLNGLVHSYHV